MRITRRTVAGVTLLDLKGALTAWAADIEAGNLRAAVSEVAAGGRPDVALNLTGLTDVDARGLGELVVALKTVRNHGGRLTLVAPPPRVQRMLSVTRLDTVFELCDDEAELRSTFGSFGRSGRSDRSEAAEVSIGSVPLSSAISV